MIDLAVRGLGTILRTRLGVKREIALGGLVFIPLIDRRLQPRRLLLISRVRAETSEAASALSASLALAVEGLAG